MTAAGDEPLVFDRVQRCLEQVSGGSGHLASYRLDPETFTVTDRSPLADDLTAYEFTVEGRRIGEFEAAEPTGETPSHDAGAERLSGRIVLDAEGGYVTDEAGRVRLEPWTTRLDPERLDEDDGIEALLEALDRDRD